MCVCMCVYVCVYVQEFMIELTKHQLHIGHVLQQGNQIIRERHLSAQTGPQDEGGQGGAEVEAQMTLLNAQWEELRAKAMNRQTE